MNVLSDFDEVFGSFCIQISKGFVWYDFVRSSPLTIYKQTHFVCTTGHIKDPVPLIEKRRGLSPGGRFPPSFIIVIIITGLNKLYNRMFSP